ncbi:pheromone B alpha 3 receptor [Coccidioides immitis H538.4]|uniref:Pheromone B alpha 3 receptor n=1 Tax=Coccidioides immitis H538.4 TaxID=396776 RepID=A0A0J8RI61_COCIT|nr:pheromone B alpha 3 receptor [Coccidioides immitis H538.4]
MSEIQLSLERSLEGVALSVFAFLSILVCFPPLLWHSRNKNFPAVCLTVWLIVQNIFNFINPLVWPTDDIPSWWDGRGYCDIQAKLITGAGVGIAGPLACIFRSLAKVLDTEHATIMPSKGEKRRALAFDISFCVIIPAFVMAIHYIVQERRYFIYAIVGCMPSYISSWPSIVVNHMWAPLVLTVAVVYAVIVVYRLIRYKREFNYIISVSSSTNKSRFMRLFILSMVLLLGSYPVQIYVLFFNITGFGPLLPFSWLKCTGQNGKYRKYRWGVKYSSIVRFMYCWIFVSLSLALEKMPLSCIDRFSSNLALDDSFLVFNILILWALGTALLGAKADPLEAGQE